MPCDPRRSLITHCGRNFVFVNFAKKSFSTATRYFNSYVFGRRNKDHAPNSTSPKRPYKRKFVPSTIPRRNTVPQNVRLRGDSQGCDLTSRGWDRGQARSFQADCDVRQLAILFKTSIPFQSVQGSVATAARRLVQPCHGSMIVARRGAAGSVRPTGFWRLIQPNPEAAQTICETACGLSRAPLWLNPGTNEGLCEIGAS